MHGPMNVKKKGKIFFYHHKKDTATYSKEQYAVKAAEP